MATRVEVGGPGFISEFRSPTGITGRYLLNRAKLLEIASRRKLSAHNRTGALRASIYSEILYGPTGDLMARVGSDLDYAEAVDRGTPPHIIRPKSSTVLRWTNKSGEVVFARVVHHPGSEAVMYLTDVLPVVIV